MLCFDQGPFLLPKDIGFSMLKFRALKNGIFSNLKTAHCGGNRCFKPNSKLSTAFFLAARIDDKAPAFMYLAWEHHPATMLKKIRTTTKN